MATRFNKSYLPAGIKPSIMPDENKPGDDRHDKLRKSRREFEQACCNYMDEFGFEWVEEFTLNGA